MLKRVFCLIMVLTFTFAFIGCGEIPGGDLERNTSSTDQTVVRFYEELQENEVAPYELTEKAKQTLSEKPEMFMGNKSEGVEEMTDTSLEHKVLTKNIDKHGDKLVYLPDAYVLSIVETELDEETTFTELHLLDGEENSYYCLVLAEYSDIFEGDYVNVYALPIGETSFENVSGGTTLAIMLAGCYIDEVGS